LDAQLLKSIDKHLRALLIVSSHSLRQNELSEMEFDKLASELLKAGFNGTEIASILGVNQSTISRRLSKLAALRKQEQ
jgi:Fic family protein